MKDKYAHLTEFQREQMLWGDDVLRSAGVYNAFQEAEEAIEQLRKIKEKSRDKNAAQSEKDA